MTYKFNGELPLHIEHYPKYDCTFEVAGPNHTIRNPEFLIAARGIYCKSEVAGDRPLMQSSFGMSPEEIVDRLGNFRDDHVGVEVDIHSRVNGILPELGALLSAQSLEEEAQRMRDYEALRELNGGLQAPLPEWY